MRKSSKLFIFISALLCVTLIYGCGGGAGGGGAGGGAKSDAGATAAATTAASAAAAAAKETTAAAAAADAAAADADTQAAESADGKGDGAPTPITFTMWLGGGWVVFLHDPGFTDPTAREVTRRTGVTLDIQAARTSDSTQELNVILASGDLPDIFVHNQSYEPKFIAGEYVVPLDDLIDQYGPNFKKNMGHVLNYWRSGVDGKIYKVRGWVWNDPVYSLSFDVNTLYMRYDILKELGYPKIDRIKDDDGLITLDEYLGVLAQVKERYPDLIPALMDLNGSNPYQMLLMSTGTPMQGAIYEDGDVKMIYDSKYTLESILWLNKFYNDGWTPKDVGTYTREKFQALVANGEVFSAFGNLDGLAEAKAELSAEVDERRLAKFYLTKDSSVKHISANGYYIDGDCCLYMSRSCKDQVRLMQFLDWCASDEGSFLLSAGTEGLCYTMENGRAVPTEKALKAYADWDATGLKEFGLGPHGPGLPNFAGMNPDGNANDIFQQALFESDKWSIYDNKGWQHFADNSYSRAGISVFNTETQNDANDARSKINSYVSARIAKAILAPNAAACEDEWNKCYQQMKADGLDIVNAAYKENWMAQAKMFEKEPALLIDIFSDLGIPRP